MKTGPAAFFLMMWAGFAQAEPARPTLVSLDYCADQFVLALGRGVLVGAVIADLEHQILGGKPPQHRHHGGVRQSPLSA